MEAQIRRFAVVVVLGLGMVLSQRAAAQVLTPNAGSQQAFANTAGQTAVFSLFNNTGTSTSFALNPCIRTGAVTSCSAPASVFVPTGTTMNFNVTFATGAVGSGTIRVVLTSLIDDGQINVTVVAGNGVSVTPDASPITRPPYTGGYSELFTVTNTGGASNTFTFSCSGTGGVTCGTVPTGVTLGSGAQANVSMPYSVGAVGNGALTLTATGTGASDAGSFAVTIGGVMVTPANGVSAARAASTGGYSEAFTILNLGVSNTFTFSCNGINGVTCGTVPSPLALGQGAQATVSMPYSVGAAGQGILSLNAQGTGVSGGGSYFIPIATYGVAVTPDGATTPQRQASTGGYSESFTVQNTGSAPNNFSFNCTGAGGVTCGTVPVPVTIGGGAQMVVAMPYSVGAVGTGTLTLTASGTNASNPGSYSVPITLSNVSVTPKGQAADTRFANSSGYSEVFTVKNTGGASNTFSFTCAGTGGLVCGTPPGPVALGAGVSTVVSMPYSTGAAADGVLTLTATGTNAVDNGFYTVAIARSLSGVSGGLLTKNTLYLLQETANSYDSAGRFARLTDPRGGVTKYLYGSIGNAYLIKVTDSADATGTMDLVTDIGYDANGFVQSIRDQAGSKRFFKYDAFGRLTQVRRNDSTLVEAHGYTYSRTSANAWVYQPSVPNAIVDSTFMQQTPTVQAVVTTSYLDGLGSLIQSVIQDGTNYYVSATQYDAMGRPWRSWKPYTRTSAGYDPNFATNATSYYTTYHGTTAAPFAETQYRPDNMNRVRKVIPEYLGTTPSVWSLTSYGIDAAAKQQITEVADELGKKTRSQADMFGNGVKSILGYGATEATTTSLAFNALGQRTQATDPRGLNTTYTLNTRGLLTGRTSPDAGTITSKYDKAGKLRFSQDANQAAPGQVAFMNYDFAGRPLTSGVGAATFSTLDPFTTQAIETTQANWLVVRAYDLKPSAGLPWNLFTTQISPLTLNNVAGRRAAVASKSGAAWQVTLFSYDADGHIVARYSYSQNNSGASVLTAVNTRDSTVRDLRGTPTQRLLTVGASSFYHWYDYDGRGLLWKTYASTTGAKPGTPDVTDTYLPGGQPKDFQSLGGVLVPIRYTIRGKTEKIGDPSLTTYPFSARYAYLSNGVIDTAEYYSAGSPAAQKRYRYAFGATAYDALNRLKKADFSSWSGSAWTSTLNYDLAGINYDASGNITALQRYRETGVLVDNLTYTYPGSSNRLSSLTDAVGVTSTVPWDAEPGSFTYDPNGNLATAPAPYSLTTASYNYQNLPVSLTAGGVTTTYRYDDAGDRITKQVGSGNTEVYLRDGATTLGVFTLNSSGTALSWYFNLIWEGRVIGRQPSSGSRSYYQFDPLGSTRAVVQGATVVESYDYDPWGLAMPGRALGSGTKEGFSGKEQDTETGLEYFGARYYMPALGRWAAADPSSDAMPEWSSYNYVYDNPVLHTDPDGRQVAEALEIVGSAVATGVTEARVAMVVDGPVVAAGAVILSIAAGVDEAIRTRVYLTYELTNPTTHKVYSGRTSGYGDPQQIMERYTAKHYMRAEGFTDAKLDKSSVGQDGRAAIRGREQQLIDKNGGAKRQGGTSGNDIRGVRKDNPFGKFYHLESNDKFGNIAPYTGDQRGQTSH